METSLIEKFWYPKFGPGQLWEVVAQEITDRGGVILYNHKVDQVLTCNAAVSAVACSTPAGEEKYECDIVISSMPLKDLVAALTPAPPPQVCRVAEGLPYRDFITAGVLVKKMKLENRSETWRLGNRVPDCWIYVQEADVPWDVCKSSITGPPTWGRIQKTPCGSAANISATNRTNFGTCPAKKCKDLQFPNFHTRKIINKNDVIDSNCEKVKGISRLFWNIQRNRHPKIIHKRNYRPLLRWKKRATSL